MLKFILKIIIFSILVISTSIEGKLFSQNKPDDVVYISQIADNLVTPVRITLDHQDNLYVTDNNLNKVLKYDASGNFVEYINLQFTPVSVAVDKDNQIFIGDKESGNIYKRSTSGDLSIFYTACIFPADMEFSPDGLLYVADSKLQQVIALDVSGNVVKTIGKGTLIYPTTLAYDKKNERILIGEHGGIEESFKGMFGPDIKVWIFDLEGNLLSSFGSYGDADGEFYRIQGITIGKCNNIYICDSYQGNVSVFDESGTFLTKFGEFGDQTGQMDVPLGIAFDSQERILIGSINKGSVDFYNVTDVLPTSNIKNSDAVICLGETTDINIELTGSAPWSFTYTVDGLNPTIVNTNDINNILTVSDPGIYDITQLSDATQTGTCFTGSAFIEITNTIPTANISSEDVSICQGEQTDIQINFTGLSPWEFTYTLDGLDPINIKTANNPYYLDVKDEGLYEILDISGKGCSGTIYDGTSEIIVNPFPTSTFIEENGVFNICEGSSVELTINFTGTTPWSFKYMIDENDTTSISGISNEQYVLNTSKIGAYKVIEITDANCINFASEGYPEVIENPKSIPDFDFETTAFDVIFSNKSQYADSYYWDFDDSNSSAEENPIHTYTAEGTYIVSLTTTNIFCEDVSISKSITISNTSVLNFEKENQIKLFPNPTRGIIEVDVENYTGKGLKIEILNMKGQKVYSTRIESNQRFKKINLTSLNSGIYLIKINNGNESLTSKLILNK